MKDDIEDDSHMHLDGLVSSGGGEFKIHFAGPTSPDFFSDPAFENTNSIGGCNMDFSDTESRGYIYKSSDPRDIEFKMLCKFTGFGDNGFSISGPTGEHSGDGCCSGFSYMFSCEPSTTPVEFRFRKEMWHVSYHDHSSGRWTHPTLNFKLNDHGYVGLAYVRYNKKDGRSTGHDSVILEGWFNPTPDTNPQSWFMLKRIEDKGGWGNDGDDCGGLKDQVGTWGGPKYRIKSNDPSADITFKQMSFREINPNISFDDTITPPPSGGGGGEEPPSGGGGTTTIQGSFKFQNDINTLRTQSECAGVGSGGGGGSAVFYSEPATYERVIGATEATTRITQQQQNSTAFFNGKIVKQMDVPLKKSGSPGASPVISAKIWSSGGSVVYTSPTTFAPSTLTTSYVYKTFDFSANTHAFITGDRIGIEYTGGTLDDYSAFVICGFDDGSASGDDYSQYSSGAWELKSTRNFACDLWE